MGERPLERRSRMAALSIHLSALHNLPRRFVRVYGTEGDPYTEVVRRHAVGIRNILRRAGCADQKRRSVPTGPAFLRNGPGISSEPLAVVEGRISAPSTARSCAV